MREVVAGVFIGSLADAQHTRSLAKAGITHVLSLTSLSFSRSDGAPTLAEPTATAAAQAVVGACTVKGTGSVANDGFVAGQQCGSTAIKTSYSSSSSSIGGSRSESSGQSTCDAGKPELKNGLSSSSHGSIANEVELLQLQVPLWDVDDENLLDELPRCIAFIHSALSAASATSNKEWEKHIGDGGRCTGGVLVHCHAGVSRSSAVVMAFLMHQHRPNLSVTDALAMLRQVHPEASPNAGFIRQLQLFHLMGCKIDSTHPDYKSWKLKRMAARGTWRGAGAQAQGSVERDDLTTKLLQTCLRTSTAAGTGTSTGTGTRAITNSDTGAALESTDPVDLPASSNSQAISDRESPGSAANATSPAAGTPPPTTTDGRAAASFETATLGAPSAMVYRCRKCRVALASSANVSHAPTPPAEAHARVAVSASALARHAAPHQQPVVGAAGGSACSSVFVEPLKWMADVVHGGEVEGKLACFRCGARVGSFSWSGVRCSCSEWVCPAFQLHRKSVDASCC